MVSGIPISGVIDQNTHLSVMVSLNYRNQQTLNTLLGELQDLNSPMYHKYLTSTQFDQLFSPSYSEYYSYVGYFLSKGFSVSTYSDRVSITLSGTASMFENVFHTTISRFHSNGREFYAPSSQVSLSFGQSHDISGIVGLNDRFQPKLSSMFSGSNSSETLYGGDMQAAYQLNKIYQANGYPTNETIATILWSGTDSSGADVAPYVPSDISYYFAHNLPAGEPIPTVYGYPILGAPVPGPSAANDQSQAHHESTTDLEMAGSTAPGATLVEVYSNFSNQDQYGVNKAFAAILNPSYNTSVNTALSHVVAISNSWGWPYPNVLDNGWEQYENEAAARGITVLAASGDYNNGQSPFLTFPSTVYNNSGTISVGGTTTTLDGNPSTNGSGTEGISTQSVWYDSADGDGSRGGISLKFPEPRWQNLSDDANTTIRSAYKAYATGQWGVGYTGVGTALGGPDLAAVANNMGMYITSNIGKTGNITQSGTSVASPLVAGVIASMDHFMELKGQGLEGFLDPIIYTLGQEEHDGTYSNQKPFYFISNGSNAFFSGNNGFSLAVGWGSINAYNFVKDQLDLIHGTITFTETGLPSATNWFVTLFGNGIPSNGSMKYSDSSAITFPDAPNGSYSFCVSNVNGYKLLYSTGVIDKNSSLFTEDVKYYPVGTITFTESGLPSGDKWSVYLQATDQTLSSTGSGILFTNLLYAGYTYTIISPSGYTSDPEISSVYLSSSSVVVSVSFSLLPPTHYSVTFNEKGLPSGTSWGVRFNGTLISSTSSITFYAINGSYPFSVPDTMSGKYTYVPSPSSGTILVKGSDQALTISFNTNYNSCVNLTTPILMANGSYELAEYIQAGNTIITYNDSSGELQPETVQLAYLTPQEGQVTINGFLQIAPDQKVLTNKGYVEAMNLTHGEKMFDAVTGHWDRIDSLYNQQGSFTMVDFYIPINQDYVAWFYVMEDKII